MKRGYGSDHRHPRNCCSHATVLPSPMSTLILPHGYTSQQRDELMVEAMHEMALEERYRHDPDFQRTADEAHRRGLMSGPAGKCVRCLETAAVRMERLRRWWRTMEQ